MSLTRLLQVMVEAIVDSPEAVKITETGSERRVVLELKVAPQDVGKVIGRQGRTARALRTILSSAAAKHGKKATLDILDK